MSFFRGVVALAILLAPPVLRAQTSPAIALVANAEGERAIIAPNTWVEVKGSNLAPAGDSRIWQTPDFVNGQLPTKLDGVGVMVNGKAAYVYYISPTQVNILTPADTLPASVTVVVTNNGALSAAYTVAAQNASPSSFVINGGPYVLAQHIADYSLVGPANLYPGSTTAAKAGETVVLYANGFGPVTPAVVNGAESQTGTLPAMTAVKIGGVAAQVNYAGINGPPGLFQFNVIVPAGLPGGDNLLTASYNGVSTSPAALIAIQASTTSTFQTFYVAPNGNDSWTGTLASPNPAGTDGPFANFDQARAAVRSLPLNKSGLSQVNVEFRGGTYILPATEMFAAADSGSAITAIVYQNFPGETPVFSGGMRVANWTNTGGNVWKTTLPDSTQYFENQFYNGVRRLRPRLGGYLGTYYRYIGPVYLSGAAPPASPPDPNCTEYFAGSGWECFDRFQYSRADPIASTWKNLAPARRKPLQPALWKSGPGGRYRAREF